jgi:hypothetical protein
MCFSEQADLVAGGLLVPVGLLTLREVRHAREIPFAALPLLFAAHQLVEALVWAHADGDASARVGRAAALVYTLFALPVLPTLVPLAVLLLEPRGARARVAPFVVLGLVVSAYLGHAVLDGPVTVTVHDHAISYGVGVGGDVLWTGLYVVAVIGPSVLSGYPSIVAFGALNLIGLLVVAVLLTEVFASVWCVYAALVSVLVLVHMVRRRRLPDPHRLHGEPLAAHEGTRGH